MIIDYLKNSALYENIHPLFSAAFRGAEKLICDDAPVGRYDIDGDNVYAVISEYETVAPEEKLFEAHEKYIDIQLLMNGCEECHAAFIDKAAVVDPYDSNKDCAMFEEPDCYDVIPLCTDKFAIFFPQDVHCPGISVTDASAPVKKMVVKILL